MDSRDSTLLLLGLGAIAVVAVVMFALVAPTWDDGKTTALIAGVIGCPTVIAIIGGIAITLDWRDKRQSARRESEMARRQQGINVKAQDAQEFGVNAFVMRQTLDLLGQVAQVQARQAGAGLADMRQQLFAQRSIEAPAKEIEQPWFTGEWQYDDQTTDEPPNGGIRYL